MAALPITRDDRWLRRPGQEAIVYLKPRDIMKTRALPAGQPARGDPITGRSLFEADSLLAELGTPVLCQQTVHYAPGGSAGQQQRQWLTTGREKQLPAGSSSTSLSSQTTQWVRLGLLLLPLGTPKAGEETLTLRTAHRTGFRLQGLYCHNIFSRRQRSSTSGWLLGCGNCGCSG
jgi:hypothetical protein